jgi:hypothetical protein
MQDGGVDAYDLADYNEALHRQSSQLDSQLAILRNREASGALTVREAADERVRILETHLESCRALRARYSVT